MILIYFCIKHFQQSRHVIKFFFDGERLKVQNLTLSTYNFLFTYIHITETYNFRKTIFFIFIM